MELDNANRNSFLRVLPPQLVPHARNKNFDTRYVMGQNYTGYDYVYSYADGDKDEHLNVGLNPDDHSSEADDFNVFIRNINTL